MTRKLPGMGVLLKIAAGVALFAALAIGGLIAALQHPAVEGWLLAQANQALAQTLDARVSVAKLSGSKLFGLRGRGVEFWHGGRLMARADDLRVRYSLFDLLGGERVKLDGVKIEGLWVDLDVVMALADHAAGPDDDPAAGAAGGADEAGVELLFPRIELRGAAVEGRGWMGPVRWARAIDLKASLHLDAAGRLRVAASVATARAAMDGVGQELEVSAQAMLDGDGVTARELRVRAGQATAQGRAAVDWGDKLLLEGDLRLDNLLAAGLTGLQKLPPALGQGLALKVDGGLDGLNVALDNQPLQARLRTIFSYEAGVLALRQIDLQAPWGRAEGRLSLGLEQPGLWREIDLRVEDLRAPAPLAGLLSADLGQARLSGHLALGSEGQELAWRLTLKDTTLWPWLSLTSLTAQGLLAPAPELRALKAELGWARAELDGRVGPLGAQAKLTLAVDDLARGAELAAQAGWSPPAPLAGRLTADVAIDGPWSAPDLALTVQGHELVLPNVAARRASLEGHVSGLLAPTGRLRLEAQDVRSGEVLLGRLGLDYDRQAASASLDFAAQGPDLRARGRLSHAGGGWLPASGALEELRLWALGGGPWELSRPAGWRQKDGAFWLERLELVSQGQKVAVWGMIDAAGPVAANLAVENLRLATLDADLPGALAVGQLRLDAALGGTLAAPTLRFEGLLDEAAGPAAPDLDLEFAGGYEAGRLELDGLVRAKGRPTLSLAARLGLTLSLRPPVVEPAASGLDCRLWADDQDLALLGPYLPGVGALSGRLDLDLTCRGPWERPRLDGRAAIDDGRLMILAGDQAIEGLRARLSLEGHELVVEEVSARTDSGAPPLTLRGRVSLPLGREDGRWDLRLAGRGVVVGLGDLGWVSTDVDVGLAGPWAQAALQGKISPRRAMVRYKMLPPAGMSEIVVLRPGQEPPPIGRDQTIWRPGGLLAGWRMDVLIDLSERLRVEMEEGWLSAVGGLRLTKAPGGHIVYSEAVTIENGLLVIFGRRISIDRGKIAFGDKTSLDPSLDIQASLNMGSIAVFASIMGAASEPSVHLSSQPPLNQADLLSTIVFGRPSHELSGAQQEYLSAQALALLGLRGSQELRRFLGPELAPDVVTVHDSRQFGSSLEAGKFIGEDLYLRYRKNLGEDGGQNVGVEYRLSPHFSVESQVGTTRDTGVDVLTNWQWGD